MDWDQIATVAQLVTGAATLAVAGFLSSQLRIQHRDSERDFAFANETKQQDLVASYYSDESAANLLWKAYNDYESLSPMELNRFRVMYQQMATAMVEHSSRTRSASLFRKLGSQYPGFGTNVAGVCYRGI